MRGDSTTQVDPHPNRPPPHKQPTLEICCASIASVHAAAAAGAHRIELCTDLPSGGTTPSYGLIVAAVAALAQYRPDPIPLMVLVRPRPGSFVYSADEVAVMKGDVRAARTAGARGVVLGCLRYGEDGRREVDVCTMRELLDVVKEESWRGEAGDVTFHRAFDDCEDLLRALHDVHRLGSSVRRILTSGGHETALQGSASLRALCERASRLEKPSVNRERLSVMPGAGITKENLVKILKDTGCWEVHASAKVSIPSTGVSEFFASGDILQTDSGLVKSLLQALARTALD
ncbi:hypothetical protein FH972_024338 [Carpinus fangiana]|uniref:Copper homeostasis protein cutC homolog n=1 Tax=Carpinus fangiana TaxID=176857 RepID=A0A5N6KY56_9ROSI|nr:hypothetical protein FH972_024338 [Carpinus fangiana]